MAVTTVLQILTPLALTQREDGRLVLELWEKYLPNLLPDRYGNWEPVDFFVQVLGLSFHQAMRLIVGV
jgi:hypothetical protein